MTVKLYTRVRFVCRLPKILKVFTNITLILLIKMFTCHRCDAEVRDGVQCTVCQNHFDFPCAGITEAGYRKLGDRKATWKCTACKTGASSPHPSTGVIDLGKTVTQVDLNKIHQELKNLSKKMSSLPQLIENVYSIQADLAELKAIKSEVSDLKTSLEHAHTTVEALSIKVAEMNRELQSFQNTKQDILRLEQRLERIETTTRDNEQRSRLNNVEIKGIPVVPSENLFEVVSKISCVVGCKISKDNINYIVRVP